MTITVKLEAHALDTFLSELTKPDAFLPQLGAAVKEITERRFSTKHDSNGSSWAAWSTSYAKTRKPSDSLLIDISTHRSGPHLRDSFEIVYEPHAVEVGSNVVYAQTHQSGRGRIPPRPFLGLGEQDVPTIETAMAAAFMEMQARAMGASR